MSLPTPSQSVSQKRFHQCVNHKKKLTLRHPSPTFGSFSFFQASIWLGVDKVLQELTKSYKNELRHLLQCCILIPRGGWCHQNYYSPQRILRNSYGPARNMKQFGLGWLKCVTGLSNWKTHAIDLKKRLMAWVFTIIFTLTRPKCM